MLFNFGMATDLGEGKEFKPAVDLLRNGLRQYILVQSGLVGWLVVSFYGISNFSSHLMPNYVILIKICMFDLVLWHINHCSLFNTKFIYAYK